MSQQAHKHFPFSDPTIVDVLHVDNHLLVVNKPPGVLAQPDETGDEDVLSLARNQLDVSSEDFLGLVHRLDRPTSGIMVLARTPEAARSLSAQFREREVEKRYVALVEGTLRGIGTWTDFIAKPGRQPQIVSSEHPEGKRAELDWMALDSDSGRTLLQVELKTGRPHQIRLQAAERGHPVVGDRRYGAEPTLGDAGIALHHALLRVEHPSRARRATFTAMPPPLWANVTNVPMETAIQDLLSRAGPTDPADV